MRHHRRRACVNLGGDGCMFVTQHLAFFRVDDRLGPRGISPADRLAKGWLLVTLPPINDSFLLFSLLAIVELSN